MKITKTFTLSSYGDVDKDGKGIGIGIGHRVDGKPPQHPSFSESLGPLSAMIDEFRKLPTGTKIKVTMEEVVK